MGWLVAVPGVLGPIYAEAQVINGLPMSQAALVGRFAQGPIDLPVPVGPMEFAATFSSGNPSAWPAEIQAREFFANGGTSLYVVRVSDAIPLRRCIGGTGRGVHRNPGPDPVE